MYVYGSLGELATNTAPFLQYVCAFDSFFHIQLISVYFLVSFSTCCMKLLLFSFTCITTCQNIALFLRGFVNFLILFCAKSTIISVRAANFFYLLTDSDRLVSLSL